MPDGTRGQEPASAPPETYRSVTGKLVKCSFTEAPDELPEPGSPFRVRTLRRANNGAGLASPVPQQVIQRRLIGPAPSREWAASDVLDNEIRVGLQLIRAFGDDDSYPLELSRLVGYDIDADEPFVLLLPYRGEAAENVAGRLSLELERKFQAGLFRAIKLLQVADVVHGRISPDTVRWDGATVQLVDFSRATRAGEPRRRTGQRPWSAAEQVSGTGTADPGDDVWSAGQLVYHVTTSRPVDPNGGPPDLTVRGAALQSLLADVFAADAAARPRADELLRRLKVSDPWPGEAGAVSARFAEGMRKFDERRAAKSPSGKPGPGTRNPVSPPKKTRNPLRWLVGMVVIAFVIAGIIYAAGIS